MGSWDEWDERLPTRKDTTVRIQKELRARGRLDQYLRRLIASIPEDNLRSNEAVEKVTSILVRTFAFVRSFIADELELFSCAFYQLPMLRRLEQYMQDICLDEEMVAEVDRRKRALEKEIAETERRIKVVAECELQIK